MKKDSPPTQEQRAIIKDLFKKHGKLTVGDSWYLVSFKWYKLWKELVGYEHEDGATSSNIDVGAIDNTDLVNAKANSDDPPNLRANLQDEYDYVLLPEQAWNYLHEWYGGGPAIARKVIAEGLNNKTTRVEVYPLRIKILNTKKDGSLNLTSEVELSSSKKATLSDFRKQGCDQMELEPAHVRLWNSYYANSKNAFGKEMKDITKTLEDANIIDGQKIIFEVQLEDGSWPKGGKSSSGTTGSLIKRTWGFFWGSSSNSAESANGNDPRPSSSFPDADEKESGGGNYAKGVCGLYNLGNTCFMNSALQCLSNAAPLTDFFVSGRFKNEINKNNPLGMKGQIAEQYGKLVKELWSGSSTAVTPRSFKGTLGKYAPQFSGFAQQDAQELLSFLLDGLHEDLNRITKKPYIEDKNEDGSRPDNEVAEEMWENHLKRNRSVIVDLFQGQLKSTLVCPVCNKVSITFDPFMYLSLPLPIPQHRVLDVVLVRYTSRKNCPMGPALLDDTFEWMPVKYSVKVKKKGTVEELKSVLSTVCGISQKNLALADVYGNRIYSFLNDMRAVSGIREKDLTVAYELPEVTGDEYIRVHVIQRRENNEVPASSVMSYQKSHVVLFGIPLVLVISKQMTGSELYEMVWERVKRHVSKPGINNKKTAEKSEKKDNKDSSRDKDKKKDTKKESPTSSHNNHNDNNSNTTTTQSDATENGSTTTPPPSGSYPFALRIVNSYGTGCGKCSVSQGGCNGCLIEPDANLISSSPLGSARPLGVGVTSSTTPHGSGYSYYGSGGTSTSSISSHANGHSTHNWRDVAYTLAIEWEPEVFQSDYDPDSLKVQLDRSVIENSDEAKKENMSLTDCLTLFTTNERLGPDDPWYCPSCKAHQQAFKKFDIWNLPQMLVVHLKRFQYDRYTRDKLSILVDFPIHELDLSDFVMNKQADRPAPIYELFAISNHSGGLGGGHYTAFAKNKENNTWYHFNDNSCKPVEESQIKSSAAYMLFYQLKDIDKTYPPPAN